MSLASPLLIQALRDPQACLSWSMQDWELLLQQARRANLVGRLGEAFEAGGLLERVPEGPRPHLVAAGLLSSSQSRAVLWEARQIRQALRELPGPVVLLKGAAYALAGLPAARGRLFNDVDILVPKPQLAKVEAALMLEGWHGEHRSAYDQRYYRRWMHEIPPMTHVLRHTVIDVHHNILPLTSRIKVDAERLLAHVRPIDGWPGLYRLGDSDLVLHSACHLFLDGEFDKGLRDLVDLDALLRHGGREPGFWPQLLARARELGLARILFYALRYTRRLLQTPMPDRLEAQLADAAPGRWQLAGMDALFERALRPDHASCNDRWTGPARRFLYLRAHWMRMPLHLLLTHLTVKALRREPEPA
jgi:Uncharacterised nucleotidyltransferase